MHSQDFIPEGFGLLLRVEGCTRHMKEEEKQAKSMEWEKGEGEGRGPRHTADRALRCTVSLLSGLLFLLAAYPSPSQLFSCRFCAAFLKLPPQHFRKDFINILEVPASD